MLDSALQSALQEKRYSQFVLEKQRLGSGWVLWVRSEQIKEIARLLFDDSTQPMDALEAVTSFEMPQERVVVMTYFLRSWSQPERDLKIRYSLPLPKKQKGPKEYLEIPSVADIWKQAVPMEKQLSKQFQMKFV